MGGYDLHYNDDIDTENNGTYSSVSKDKSSEDLFHEITLQYS